MNNSNHRGFTLVEMLVVIAIIGILSAVVFASFSSARANSRDKARMSDLAQIQLALKLYQQEHGHYPRESDGFSGSGAPGVICESCTGPINAEIQKYSGTIPEDPRHDGSQYYYYYDARHNCAGAGSPQAVVFAKRAETASAQNMTDTICYDASNTNNLGYGTEGRGGGNQDSYYIILGPSAN